MGSKADSVTIPQPLSSGATDQPTAPQSGTPDLYSDLPPGYSAPSTAPKSPDLYSDLPAGYSRPSTAPQASYDPNPAATLLGRQPAEPAGAWNPARIQPITGPLAPGNDYAPTPGFKARTAGEATEAYHHPLEALKGAAKGVVGVMGNVLPGVQSENVDQKTLADNPYISQSVKTALAGPQQQPQDLSGGVVSGILQPQNTAQQAGADAANIYAGVQGARQLAKTLPSLRNPIENPVSQGRYLPEGANFSGVMRSNSHFDMPAEASQAIPALKEAAADIGTKPSDFQGMNGPTMTKRIVDHAIDINEARNVRAIDPVRSQPADVSTSQDLADLMDKKNPTVGDVDKFRMEANKKLSKSGYYGQSPSQQYSAGPDLAKLESAASQARDLVYDDVYKHTGVDIRPQKQIEASLIKLNDVANSTNNTLSQQEAKFQNTPIKDRILGSVKRLIAIKANPTNAFEPGVSSPTDEFNANMKKVFQNDGSVTPGSVMKNAKLLDSPKGVLTPPPGVTPPEPNRQLNLDLQPAKQQPKFNLEPPPGVTPPEPDRQLSLNMRPGHHGFNLEPPPGVTPPTPSQQYGLPGFGGPSGVDANVPPQPDLVPTSGATRLPASSIPTRLQLAAENAKTGPRELPIDMLRKMGISDPSVQEEGLAQRARSAEVAKKYPVEKGSLAKPPQDPFNAPTEAAGPKAQKSASKPMPEAESQLDALKRKMGIKPETVNGSGESSASQEAINRAKSEKTAGVKRVVVDTRSGNERPLVGVDAVDYTPKPYESVEFRGGKRDGEIIDQGSSARKYKRK